MQPSSLAFLACSMVSGPDSRHLHKRTVGMIPQRRLTHLLPQQVDRPVDR
jgi:hypothetical protein